MFSQGISSISCRLYVSMLVLVCSSVWKVFTCDAGAFPHHSVDAGHNQIAANACKENTAYNIEDNNASYVGI